jgi:hypothetical protein
MYSDPGLARLHAAYRLNVALKTDMSLYSCDVDQWVNPCELPVRHIGRPTRGETNC